MGVVLASTLNHWLSSLPPPLVHGDAVERYSDSSIIAGLRPLLVAPQRRSSLSSVTAWDRGDTTCMPLSRVDHTAEPCDSHSNLLPTPTVAAYWRGGRRLTLRQQRFQSNLSTQKTIFLAHLPKHCRLLQSQPSIPQYRVRSTASAAVERCGCG